MNDEAASLRCLPLLGSFQAEKKFVGGRLYFAASELGFESLPCSIIWADFSLNLAASGLGI
jgi:hypothetical protein